MNLRNFSHKSNFIFETNLFGENSTYTIQSCNLPGISLNPVETSNRGMNLSFQGDTLNYNELNLEFILEEDFSNWTEIINHFDKMRKIGSDTGNIDEKMSTLFIQNDNQKTLLKLKFFNCKATSISDIDFSSNEDDDEEITFTVTIKYDYFIIENRETED